MIFFDNWHMDILFFLSLAVKKKVIKFYSSGEKSSGLFVLISYNCKFNVFASLIVNLTFFWKDGQLIDHEIRGMFSPLPTLL